MKHKVIIKRPDEQYGHVTNISMSLENLQRTVGGYIETIPAVGGAIIICNEEGKIKELEPNMWYYHDQLRGTIIVCGREGEELSDIPISLSIWKQFVDTQAGFAKGISI